MQDAELKEKSEKFTEYLLKDEYEKAIEVLKGLAAEEQAKILKASLKNKIIDAPDYFAVIHRRLKPNFTYQDFYKAWLPASSNDLNGHHYFQIPCQVVNAENASDPSEIISIGMVWGDEQTVAKELNRVAEFEKNRHDSIAEVAEKIGQSQFYVFKDITKHGV